MVCFSCNQSTPTFNSNELIKLRLSKSDIPDPSHVYTVSGGWTEYTVSLTVENEFGSSNREISLWVSG